MSIIYEHGAKSLMFSELHDETGGKLGQMTFKYYDCPCGEKKYSVISTTTRHDNHFDIVKCSKCGTLRMNPYLTDESIELYYTEVYGPLKREWLEGTTPESVFQRQKKSSAGLYNNIKKHLNSESKILDYGSSSGGRLDALREDNFGSLHLFDFDENYLSYGLGKGFNRHEESNKYDFMILSHVLEHINDPVEFLREIKEKTLNSCGKIYIEVPFMERKDFLLEHFHLAHKYYFTRESLTYITQLAGYECLEVAKKYIIIEAKSEAVIPDESLLEKSRKISSKHLVKVKLNRYTRKFFMLFRKKESSKT